MGKVTNVPGWCGTVQPLARVTKGLRGAKTSRWTVCPRAERRRTACRPRGARTPRADSQGFGNDRWGSRRGPFLTSTHQSGRPAAENCRGATHGSERSCPRVPWWRRARAAPRAAAPARVDAGRSGARRPPHTRRPASQAPCPAPTQMRERSGAGGPPGSAKGQVPANPLTSFGSPPSGFPPEKQGRRRRRLSHPQPHAPERTTSRRF